jgi:hypothetical protein
VISKATTKLIGTIITAHAVLLIPIDKAVTATIILIPIIGYGTIGTGEVVGIGTLPQ